MRLRLSASLILAAALLPGQAPHPTFEIADVHVSPKTLHPARKGGAVRDGRYELQMATMVDLVAAAWGVPANYIMGGPSWLELDRFDVIARAPANTSPQVLRLMLQALLTERFKLVVHMDKRPMPAYVLSVGDGKPKMTASESGPPGCQRQAQPAEAGPIPATCHDLTMAAFAAQLSGAAGDYLAGPVADDTKLDGAWDFTLKWTPRGRLAAAGADGVTIFDAIDKQLGLKLELKQVPTPVLVVDSANRIPTDNPPGVTASLPPTPPAHLEVATIKPTAPEFQGVKIEIPPNGRINIQGATLSFLMQNIWFITPEMIVGAPKWLDTDRWDIVAKVSSEPGTMPQVDTDSVIQMVRALLEERFQLKTHTEERVVPALTLTAVKPKLQKADPANRTGCKEGPGADGKDPRVTNPVLSRLVTCRNMTMAQFAEHLPILQNATIHAPVLDSTGLEGAWDFTLSFTGELPAAQNSAAGAGPADPNGAISFADAISRELGLKLDVTKRPVPVVAIDHVEQKPTDN